MQPRQRPLRPRTTGWSGPAGTEARRATRMGKNVGIGQDTAPNGRNLWVTTGTIDTAGGGCCAVTMPGEPRIEYPGAATSITSSPPPSVPASCT